MKTLSCWTSLRLLTGLSVSSIFFFSWSRAHRDLHSFPTRRSSDLRRAAHHGEDADRGPSSAGGAGRPRSEEHTSELQSLTNLVCRLLLEKKKNNSKKKKSNPTLSQYH